MKDNGVSKRMLLIGSLKNIRLSLNEKRKVSPTISRDVFGEIIKKEKAGNTDIVLSSMIDDVFKEYFVEPSKTNEHMSLNDMQKIVDASENQGISFIKRDNNHFKTNSESGKDAA